ncbi:hypothetical protein H4Q26_007941 [Puccinia striiformis f. sp. tritici PST-130]|nr:hypothetical protein H4Q26_007941 [Puccinia striiformis f. sp. tritici PST-130]
MFLKRSLILAESYDELAFDLKTAFKAFEKRSLADDDKPFDGIATLLSDLESLSPSTDASNEDPPPNNILAISVRLRMLALLANDSSFEASLHRNANALLKTIVALLRNATGLMNESLEASEIPKWLASSLLIVEAILAYAKDKPASEIERSRPASDDLDENEEDDEEDDKDADNPMPDSVAFLGLPALINEPRQGRQPGCLYLGPQIDQKRGGLIVPPRKAPAKSSSSSTFTLADLKSKHEIWNFMLCDLIPTGPLSQPNTTESQKKSAIASWAIMVLVALTVDTRYGRLYALSDLTFRLLTATPFAQRPSASPSEAPIQIAKIMLEKNYAALLSNALADVDLNFPSVQRGSDLSDASDEDGDVTIDMGEPDSDTSDGDHEGEDDDDDDDDDDPDDDDDEDDDDGDDDDVDDHHEDKDDTDLDME